MLAIRAKASDAWSADRSVVTAMDLDEGRLSVRQTLISVAYKAQFSEPKTKRSRRTIAIDPCDPGGAQAPQSRAGARAAGLGSCLDRYRPGFHAGERPVHSSGGRLPGLQGAHGPAAVAQALVSRVEAHLRDLSAGVRNEAVGPLRPPGALFGLVHATGLPARHSRGSG